MSASATTWRLLPVSLVLRAAEATVACRESGGSGGTKGTLVSLVGLACLVFQAVTAYLGPREEKETPQWQPRKGHLGSQETQDWQGRGGRRATAALAGFRAPPDSGAFKVRVLWVSLEIPVTRARKAGPGSLDPKGSPAWL